MINKITPSAQQFPEVSNSLNNSKINRDLSYFLGLSICDCSIMTRSLPEQDSTVWFRKVWDKQMCCVCKGPSHLDNSTLNKFMAHNTRTFCSSVHTQTPTRCIVNQLINQHTYCVLYMQTFPNWAFSLNNKKLQALTSAIQHCSCCYCDHNQMLVVSQIRGYTIEKRSIEKHYLPVIRVHYKYDCIETLAISLLLRPAKCKDYKTPYLNLSTM